jgi:hypothetical protein
MKLLQALARHVRVYLRRRYIAVSEQHLHHTQIGPVVDQMGGECMAQHMRVICFAECLRHSHIAGPDTRTLAASWRLRVR